VILASLRRQRLRAPDAFGAGLLAGLALGVGRGVDPAEEEAPGPVSGFDGPGLPGSRPPRPGKGPAKGLSDEGGREELAEF